MNGRLIFIGNVNIVVFDFGGQEGNVVCFISIEVFIIIVLYEYVIECDDIFRKIDVVVGCMNKLVFVNGIFIKVCIEFVGGCVLYQVMIYLKFRVYQV